MTCRFLFALGTCLHEGRLSFFFCSGNNSTKGGLPQLSTRFKISPKLLSQVSTVQVKGEPILARRFDGTAKFALTYVIFGTSKQFYMVHFLTDDQSSFDQIIGIESLDPNLKAAVEKSGASFVTVPVIDENGLNAITDNANQVSPNNKWKLPVPPVGKLITVIEAKSSVTGKIKVTGEIHFNKNEDLRK